MLDIGWSEMAVIAIVALIVLGPKELPNALRTAAQWMRTARKLAREFQGGVDQIVREAELEDARKTVQQAGGLNLRKEIEKVVDPTGEAKKAMNEDPDKLIGAGKPAGAASPTAPSAPAVAEIAGPAPAAAAPAAATPAAEPGTSVSGVASEPATAGEPRA